jgi:hypothetical protein
MSLCITTTLNLVSMSNGVFDSSPRTSYLKAIDIWMLICFSFTFAALLEFCIVIYLNKVKGAVQVRKTLQPYLVVGTNILYYRQTVSSVRISGPPEGERSHKRLEAIEQKMNFRIMTTLLNMIWVEL